MVNNNVDIPPSRKVGPPQKVCDISGVRQYGNGNDFPIELWLNDSGRLVIRAYNEAGYSGTEVDLYDLVNWFLNNGYVSEASMTKEDKKPDFIYDPSCWEATYPFPDYEYLLEDYDIGEIVKLFTLNTGPVYYAVFTYKPLIFTSEEEAQKAVVAYNESLKE